MADKNKGGRPTLYKKEYCEMIIDYFRIQPQVMKSKVTYFADGSIKSKEEYPVAALLPTFQSFADKINVNIDTLHEWREKHPEFSEAYSRAKQLQEHIWLVNGMSNLYNAQFAQFFGKNCLGYKDKTEVESNVESHNINENHNYDELSKRFVANATPEEIARAERGDMTVNEQRAIIDRK